MAEAEDRDEGRSPWRTLERLRARRPFVHVITNTVAADLTANLLLAAGATVAMAERLEEVEDFTGLADALAVNLGTLTNSRIEAMVLAARTAVEQGKPWILDPVAAGASRERRAVAARLTGLQPTVIRGNASEILCLGEAGAAGGAVDTAIEATEALDAARDLACASGALIAITGAVDYVTDGSRILAVANGHPLMGRVTGAGCALTALLAACCAVETDALAATCHGLAIHGLAGERAAAGAAGPGSFRNGWIDALYVLDEAGLSAGVRIE